MKTLLKISVALAIAVSIGLGVGHLSGKTSNLASGGNTTVSTDSLGQGGGS